MRVGAENKKKTWIALALFALAILAVVYELWPSSSTSTPSSAAAPAATRGGQTATPVFSNLDPTLRTDLLKGSENVTYHGSGRDIFHSSPEMAEIQKAPDPRIEKQKAAAAAAVPQNPQIPLKFYGFATDSDRKQIFLSQGDDVFVAKEGDIVKGRYKVVHVNSNNVEIQDVLGNYSQSIPLTLPNS